MYILCFGNPMPCMGSQKETISTFVLPLFNGLWPLNKATRFTGGRLLEDDFFYHIPFRNNGAVCIA